jgi:LuxR family transcriptional regulator, maltose regulon positive regulatory protein
MNQEIPASVKTQEFPVQYATVSLGKGLEGSFVKKDGRNRALDSIPIRIFTLGRFEVAVNNQTVRSTGKGSHRPLDLLMALIALGGRGIAYSRLCECLWPDSEGDLGIGNLSVTVHRLRVLLRFKASVVSNYGRLSLNEAICQVDAWSFERAANAGLERGDDELPGNALEKQLRQALGLYTGDFLARESEISWMLATRLRLKFKYERLVAALVGRLEREGRIGDATEICLQALERDPLNELLYRRLICCHLKRGELAEATRIFNRCREALARGLAMTPSVETQRIYFEGVRGRAAESETARILTLPCRQARPEKSY